MTRPPYRYSVYGIEVLSDTPLALPACTGGGLATVEFRSAAEAGFPHGHSDRGVRHSIRVLVSLRIAAGWLGVRAVGSGRRVSRRGEWPLHSLAQVRRIVDRVVPGVPARDRLFPSPWSNSGWSRCTPRWSQWTIAPWPSSEAADRENRRWPRASWKPGTGLSQTTCCSCMKSPAVCSRTLARRDSSCFLRSPAGSSRRSPMASR